MFSPPQAGSRPKRRVESASGFTLIELLVTLAGVLFVLTLLFSSIDLVQRVGKKAASDPFAEASDAFSAICTRAADATLLPYQDYADVNSAFRTRANAISFMPDHLARRSDLALVCGPAAGATGWLAGCQRTVATDALFFAAPRGYTQSEANQGVTQVLNAEGFFIEFGAEENAPDFLSNGANRLRWRLRQVAQPSEALGLFSIPTSAGWVSSLVQIGDPVSVLAENVIALLVLPERAPNDPGAGLAPSYNYDSRDPGNPLTRNQLPARLHLALIAIAEPSAVLLARQNGNAAPAVIPPGLFIDATQMEDDLATVDGQLTAARIQHRIFNREIILPGEAFTNTLSQ